MRKTPLQCNYFLYLRQILCLILCEREILIVNLSSFWNHSRATGDSRKQWNMGKAGCVNVKYKWPSIQQDRVCHRYTPKWKRATITLGWVLSKQINYLWTMNIAYCSQNCCCLSFIRQQIWFTRLDFHFHGSWILITFLHWDMEHKSQQARSWYLFTAR